MIEFKIMISPTVHGDVMRADWITPGGEFRRCFYCKLSKKVMDAARSFEGSFIVVDVKTGRIIMQHNDCFQLAVNHLEELRQKEECGV